MLWWGRNTANKYHCHVWEGSVQWLGHTKFAPTHGVCDFPVYSAQPLSWSARKCLRQALACMHFPGLSCWGSVSRVFYKGAELVGPAFCALPRSKQLRWPGDWQAQSPPGWGGCILSPPLSQPLGFLGVQCACLLRCAVCLFWGADHWLRPSRLMLTIQNPKKCWLAMKPAWGLVEDASVGPWLRPSGSGCPHLPVSGGRWAGLQPVSSAQTFVLWVALAVS